MFPPFPLILFASLFRRAVIRKCFLRPVLDLHELIGQPVVHTGIHRIHETPAVSIRVGSQFIKRRTKTKDCSDGGIQSRSSGCDSAFHQTGSYLGESALLNSTGFLDIHLGIKIRVVPGQTESRLLRFLGIILGDCIGKRISPKDITIGYTRRFLTDRIANLGLLVFRQFSDTALIILKEFPRIFLNHIIV